MKKKRCAVVALPSAPACRGSSSWKPPARDAPGTQAFACDFSSSFYPRNGQSDYFKHTLFGTSRFFHRRGTWGAAGLPREEDGVLCEAEIGDKLVLARRGMDRELLIWLVKSTQGREREQESERCFFRESDRNRGEEKGFVCVKKNEKEREKMKTCLSLSSLSYFSFFSSTTLPTTGYLYSNFALQSLRLSISRAPNPETSLTQSATSVETKAKARAHSRPAKG